MWLMLPVSILLAFFACDGHAARNNDVKQTIAELLTDYDIRLRPNFGGEPCYIGMDITIASFDSISEVNMDYTITMYLNQQWTDDRLSFSSDDEVITLPGEFAEMIWVPDTFFANDKNSYLHDVTEKNKMIRLRGDGTITYGMRFTTTLACMMDLHYFPLDMQKCSVEILSYGYTLADLVMYWQDIAVVGVEQAELPQFTIVGYNTTSSVEELATGRYGRLTITFELSRNIGYFIFQTYLPSIIIVNLSWVSFWINHEAPAARVTLGITTVLTMTTISTGVRASLPSISYLKAIDIYLVMCFVFVFAALLEYAAVNFLFWSQKTKKPKKVKPAKQPKPAPPLHPPGKMDGVANQPDEIIELQDATSPIPSIRHRHNSKLSSRESNSQDLKSPPSFRTNRNYMSSRSLSSTNKQLSRKKLIASIRKEAAKAKASIPKLTDVTVIDHYSRVIFPVAFMIFNIGYWGFYYA
ncbi:gamma-aminobutyric acid receptor subunit beta-like [Hyalella azteca]|uniref:Gamma-aminobutyric acid receptor subunit beta n=1 Tax=Hyalella azteca TaxID=294128 RepID=A0A8B7NW87_HYAAZ|nr:gamma-aminobutyric acid receptor subunit beta-like [Hyalella azteca]